MDLVKFCVQMQRAFGALLEGEDEALVKAATDALVAAPAPVVAAAAVPALPAAAAAAAPAAAAPPPAEPAAEPTTPATFGMTVEKVQSAQKNVLVQKIVDLDIGDQITGPGGELWTKLNRVQLQEAVVRWLGGGAESPAGAAPAVAAPAMAAPAVAAPAAATPAVAPPGADGDDLATRVAQFQEWAAEVTEGGPYAFWTQAQADQSTKLAETLAGVKQEKEAVQEHVKQFFAKMGCTGVCSSCPISPGQVTYCYGLFEDQVPHFNTTDALEGRVWKTAPSPDPLSQDSGKAVLEEWPGK